MTEDSKTVESEDGDDEGANEEIKEEVHELQDYKSEESEEEELVPEE